MMSAINKILGESKAAQNLEELFSEPSIVDRMQAKHSIRRACAALCLDALPLNVMQQCKWNAPRSAVTIADCYGCEWSTFDEKIAAYQSSALSLLPPSQNSKAR